MHFCGNNSLAISIFSLFSLVSKRGKSFLSNINSHESCQFHQVETSLLKSGLLQLVFCRLVQQSNLQRVCGEQVLLIDPIWFFYRNQINVGAQHRSSKLFLQLLQTIWREEKLQIKTTTYCCS